MVVSPEVLEPLDPLAPGTLQEPLEEPRASAPEPTVAARKSPAMTKVYAGRFVSGRREVVVRANGASVKLRCLDFNTPTFAWGYHGGAPEELAIAILHDSLGAPTMMVENRVLQLYRAFADEIVANFDYGSAWSITEGVVAKWIAAHESRTAKALTAN